MHPYISHDCEAPAVQHAMPTAMSCVILDPYERPVLLIISSCTGLEYRQVSIFEALADRCCWPAGEMVDMVAILYTQADVDQYKSDDFKASADRMGNGLLAKHDASGPPKEPAVYSARSGKLMDFSLNRERSIVTLVEGLPI